MKIILSILFILVLSVRITSAADLWAPGERVVFLGDSITYSGKFIEYLRCFSALNDNGKETYFYNLGIPGDTCIQGLKRVEREVLPLKPNVVFVMFGMNDMEGWRFSKAEKQYAKISKAAERFRKSLPELIDVLQTHGCRVVLLTPTPYDQYGTQKGILWTDYNEKGLAPAAEFVRDLANKRNLPCIDLFAPITKELKDHPELRICGDDRIHPKDRGHLLIAKLIWASLQGQVNSENARELISLDSNNVSKPIIMRSYNLAAKATQLRESDWMIEVAVRRGGNPNDIASIDNALEQELSARKGSPSYKKYLMRINKYRDTREKLPALKEKFKQMCSEMFQAAMKYNSVIK